MKGKHKTYFSIGITAVLTIVLFNYVDEVNDRIIYKIASIDGSESTRTRYSMIYASVKLLIDYPLLGIGWSRDAFLLEQYFPNWGYNWETITAFESGNAISAKSLVIRLALNNGLPLIIYLFSSFYLYFRKYFRIKAVKLFFLNFSVLSLIDGGIITSIYPWFALSFFIYITETFDLNEKTTCSIRH